MHFISPNQNLDDAQFLNALAASYAGYGQFETALRFLDLSLHIAPANTGALEVQTAILMKSGQSDLAIEKLDLLDLPLSNDMAYLQRQARASQSARDKKMDTMT